MKNNKLLVILLISFAVIIFINAIVFLYFRHVLLAILLSVFFVVAVFIYGFLVLKLLRKENLGLAEILSCGIIFTTFFFFLLSFFTLLSPVIIIIYLIMPFLIIIFRLKIDKEIFINIYRSFFKRPKIEYLIFLFPLIYAALPSSFFDTLVYHLGIPNLFLNSSGFVPTENFLYANTAIYYEIFLIPAVFLGDMVPRLVHFLLGILFIFSFIDFAVEVFELKKRDVLLLAIMSMPLTLFLICTVKNDLLSAFFIFLGMKHFFRKKIILGTVFWGFSLGIKYFNIFPFAVFLLVFGFTEFKLVLKKMMIMILIVVVLLGPMFIKNYLFVNNPVYPFFNKYFKSDSWDKSRMQIMRRDVGKLIYSGEDLLKLPYNLSFKENGFGGIIGVQFLIFLPFLVFRKKINIPYIIFAFLTILISVNFTSSIRFFYIAFLIFAIYVAFVYEKVNFRIIKVLFFLVISINLLLSFAFLERVYLSHYLVSGKLDIEEYKNHTFLSYPAISYLNKHVTEKSLVLFIGETRSYYLHHPFRISSALDYSSVKAFLENCQTSEKFHFNLKKSGIDFIIFNRSEFNRLQAQFKRLSEEDWRKLTGFLSEFKPVFRKRDLYVFKI